MFEESERYIFMVGQRQRHVGSRSEKLGFVDPNPNSWGAVKRGRTSWADVKDGTTWNKIVNTWQRFGNESMKRYPVTYNIFAYLVADLLIFLLYLLGCLPTYSLTVSKSER